MRRAGESGADTTRRASRGSRRRATTTRLVRAASRAIERSQSLVVEMSKPRDRRNPAQPSAKHGIPKAGIAYRSANHSAYYSANSERTPEKWRQGCGRDVEKRRDARSLTATRETRGRLVPQAEPRPEPQAEPQPELSWYSILGTERRTRWPGRHSEWGAAGPLGGCFVAGESISAFYLPSDGESTSGHHLKASAFIVSLPVPLPDVASSSEPRLLVGVGT